MSVTENAEEFIICRDKVGEVDAVKGKIERLFGTRVYFNEVSKDGNKEKRWVKITGGKWDRQNAKTYILGMSDPEETKVIQCSADFVDTEILEDIEKNTQAVLSKLSSKNIKISGNELAVTLALSALEELSGCSQEIVTDNIAPSLDDFAGNRNDESQRDRSASQRLDETLNQTFGTSSSSFHHYPPSIKRVFLECEKYPSEDVSDDLLHGLGSETSSNENSRNTVSEVIVRTKDDHVPKKNFTAPICRADSPENDRSVSPEQVVPDGVSQRRTSEGVSTVTDQFPSAAQISPLKGDIRKKGRGADAESLREFAKNVGYTDQEVDEGFLYVQPPMKPTEFLTALKKVKEGKQILGIEQPRGDKQRREMITENVESDDDDIMIVDDHFKSPRQNNKPISPKNKQGGLSKSEKKKNEEKQKDLAKQFQKQQNGSGTKRKSDPDSDQEQTCVMKVWEPSADMEERVRIPPRQQRLVGPVHPDQNRTNPVQSNNKPSTTFPIGHPLHMHHPNHPMHPAAPRTVQKTPSPQPSVSSSVSDSAVAAAYRRTSHKHDDLRYIIIDGSNVAMFHGNSKVFSCKGIQIAVDYFLDRGHKVTVFVPEWRKYRNYHDNRIRDQEILQKLEDSEHLVFTPSRKIKGKLVVSYDDRYILSLAEKEDSIILSNDQYRDLMREKASWKQIIEERLLMYRFVGDHFMPAEDPLGRYGPMLDDFLKKQPKTTQSAPAIPTRMPFHQKPALLPIPVAANYTYHSRQTADQNWQNGGFRQPLLNLHGRVETDGQGQGQWQMKPRQQTLRQQKPELPKRHSDVTEQLLQQLKTVFPEAWQETKLKKVLENHSTETDMNRLTNYCMEVIFE